MKSQTEFQTAIHWLCIHVGAQVDLIIDGYKSKTSSEIRQFCSQVITTLMTLEIGTPWANRAELYIGLLKVVRSSCLNYFRVGVFRQFRSLHFKQFLQYVIFEHVHLITAVDTFGGQQFVLR